MRFALYSDQHLETKDWEPPVLDVDAVILAGDIDSHTRDTLKLHKTAPKSTADRSNRV
ncbi:hypothetical protein [Rhodocyclus gracilis]|uniref:Calcineurin-like phosphoesterase domain-containing protein n=1 Tax=Rhodocyclus tenuis TaxID=1066 RepID=A0A6L5K0L2_RHOTE|nr:hypothetical protein [Rhodocyclus gracilis]MQY52454.1 hypothetical protein [Rhodocyclus gracilis]